MVPRRETETELYRLYRRDFQPHLPTNVMAQSLNEDIKDRKIRLIASCDNLPAQGFWNIKKLKILPNEQ